jgi:hypothetical protein
MGLFGFNGISIHRNPGDPEDVIEQASKVHAQQISGWDSDSSALRAGAEYYLEQNPPGIPRQEWINARYNELMGDHSDMDNLLDAYYGGGDGDGGDGGGQGWQEYSDYRDPYWDAPYSGANAGPSHAVLPSSGSMGGEGYNDYSSYLELASGYVARDPSHPTGGSEDRSAILTPAQEAGSVPGKAPPTLVPPQPNTLQHPEYIRNLRRQQQMLGLRAEQDVNKDPTSKTVPSEGSGVEFSLVNWIDPRALEEDVLGSIYWMNGAITPPVPSGVMNNIKPPRDRVRANKFIFPRVPSGNKWIVSDHS